MENLKTKSHLCHIRRCQQATALNVLMCTQHSAMVPRHLKTAASQTPHDCRTTDPNPLKRTGLTEAERAALDHVEHQLPDEPRTAEDLKRLAEMNKKIAGERAPSTTLPVNSQLRRLMRAARERASMTLGVAAHCAGIPTTMLADIESGKRTTIPKMAATRLAKALKFPETLFVPHVPSREFRERPADAEALREIKKLKRELLSKQR